MVPNPLQGAADLQLMLFDLCEEELLSDFHITKQAVLRKQYGHHPERFLDQYAQPADRNKVPADVLCLAAGEVATDSGDEDASIATADSVDSSTDQDTQVEGSLLSSIAEDIEQHELMTAAYAQVGRDFDTRDQLLGDNYDKLQRLEMVPHRWPLARLSIPLQKIVERLTRVVGCCWEVMVTRSVPRESLKSLRQVTKRLTLLLAGDLAKEVAAIFREVYTHPSKQLYDDTTVHLLCSNYWLQRIYQELLHSSSRYNATVSGERKRPCSGLARVTAHLRPLKTKRQTDNTTQVSDWIGGKCYPDTLQVWFPAHWMPHVVQQLQKKEDDYRLAHPSWFDQPEVPEKLQKSWREARESRETKFKFGTYENSALTGFNRKFKLILICFPI